MSDNRKIKSALISVFSKDGLDDLATQLSNDGVKIYSTGGTQAFLENLGIGHNFFMRRSLPNIFDSRENRR